MNSDSENNDSECVSDPESENKEEFLEESDNEIEDVNAHVRTEKCPKLNIFDWTTSSFTPVVYKFDDTNSGCKINLSQGGLLDIFENFVTNTFVDEIICEMRQYTAYLDSEYAASSVEKFVPSTREEMYLFLELCLLMPQVKKQRIKDYWSSDFIIETPIFQQRMSRNRFTNLYLHFANNCKANVNGKLYKIRLVLDHLYPFQSLVIDESIMLFKGRISFRQYIPSKRHRFGIY